MWARIMRERFGARDERSWKLRFHAQTAGCSLTWQQPYNNVARTTLQALAAVLGGCQSLHTNSLDEAYALPGEHAVTVALRTQQILAYETAVTDAADPFGGSYFLENLTARMEQAADGYISRIDEMGGMIPAIERGFPQREIADASFRYQGEIERGERWIAGVNAFVEPEEHPVDILRINDSSEEAQRAKLRALRARRDSRAVSRALAALRATAGAGGNTMPPILEAVRAYATLGEICGVFREAFGEYREPALI